MAISKNHKAARLQSAIRANNRPTQQEHFTFGVTVEQIDQFHTLLRTITAQSDMVAVCSGQALDNGSVSILGESIFNAARALRGIVDEIDAQPLCGEHQRLR